MKNPLLTYLGIAVFSISAISAQVPLNTFIGQDQLPEDSDPVCTIPIYPEVSTNLEGPLEGEWVHDFKLYTLEGDSVQLSTLMNDVKPVLLIGCNYTCYVFRGKIDVINEMQALYGDLVNILLVYTVEAHPVVDFSPYFGYENVGADNYAEGILYRQPTTYGERKEIVSEMLANEVIDVPVLIDGPCNEFWTNWGTNPNCAWLIDPDGIVYDAQKWFHKEPEDMYASIESLLDIVGTGVFDPLGAFTAEEEGEPVYYGTVENTIAAHITLTNTSDEDVLIDFIRTDESVPAGWFTAMCTDLCYSPDEDSATVFLAPGAVEEVRIDFFTDHLPASGQVSIACVNHYDPANAYTFTIYAQSIAETPVSNLQATQHVLVYPNPVQSNAQINVLQAVQPTLTNYTLYASDGRIVASGNLIAGTETITIPANCFPGTYSLVLQDDDKIYVSPLLVIE